MSFTFFFRAEKTGTITGFRVHWRTNGSAPTPTYSGGNGGTYTIQIRTGNATTKMEAANSTLIAQRSGIHEGNPAGNIGRYIEYTFTTQGSLTAGNPYVIKVINTDSNRWRELLELELD